MRRYRRAWRERALSSRRFIAPAARRAQQDAIDAIEDPVARRHVRKRGFTQ